MTSPTPRARWIAPMALAAMLLGGCARATNDAPNAAGAGSGGAPAAAESPWRTLGPQEQGSVNGSSTVRVLSARLEGSMGRVQEFAGDAESQVSAFGGEGANVRLDAEDVANGWWAMTSMTFSGSGLEHPDLVPGALYEFRAGRSTDTDLELSMIGCSGPSRGNYTYDGPPDRVVIAVEEGSLPGARRVRFTAHFVTQEGAQAVNGAFEYIP